MAGESMTPFESDGLTDEEELLVRFNVGMDGARAINALGQTDWTVRGREHYALWMAECFILYALLKQREVGGVKLMEDQLSRFLQHLLSKHNELTGRKITWGVRFQPTEGEKETNDHDR